MVSNQFRRTTESSKEKTLEITEKLCSINTALTLPFHISLRISFQIEDAIFEKVVDRISDYYVSLSAFEVEPKAIEKHGSIVWLNIKENCDLKKIHNDLVNILQNEFGIPAHDFDKAYLFHVTLYMGEDKLKADAAYTYLQNEDFPSILVVNKLVIGYSQTGRAGEYHVIKNFML